MRDRAFMSAVEQAFEVVSRRPSLTVLLGMAAMAIAAGVANASRENE